jgi:vacuolar-type H+-ATPase subunit I/STV1
MTELNPDPPDFQKQLNPFDKFSPEQIRALSEPIQVKALEHPEERLARLQNETKKLDTQLEQQRIDASFNRKKEFGLIIILMAVIGFSLFVCFQVVTSNTASEDNKKAATAAICSVLTSTISGIGAYIAGTKAAKTSEKP